MPASSTRTDFPARLSSSATIEPLMPLPTTTASYTVCEAVSCWVRRVAPIGKVMTRPLR